MLITFEKLIAAGFSCALPVTLCEWRTTFTASKTFHMKHRTACSCHKLSGWYRLVATRARSTRTKYSEIRQKKKRSLEKSPTIISFTFLLSVSNLINILLKNNIVLEKIHTVIKTLRSCNIFRNIYQLSGSFNFNRAMPLQIHDQIALRWSGKTSIL